MTSASSTEPTRAGAKEPERPLDVPEHATWDARRQEWLEGHKDLTGRWQGVVTSYDTTGRVRSHQRFDAGVADG